MPDLKFDPRNYRLHGEQNKRLIRKSLEDCGAGRSILLDDNDCIIAGNGVYAEAKELGLPVRIIESDGSELIAIKRTDLSTEDSRRKALALADNHTSDTSVFDFDAIVEDFNSDDLDAWEFEINNFNGAILDDLQENNFIESLKETSDVFEMTLSFPKVYQDQFMEYLSENGKTEIIKQVIDFICHNAEVK